LLEGDAWMGERFVKELKQEEKVLKQIETIYKAIENWIVVTKLEIEALELKRKSKQIRKRMVDMLCFALYLLGDTIDENSI
jgi:phosphopantothenoylcysteine synthetase/decarboxylase